MGAILLTHIIIALLILLLLILIMGRRIFAHAKLLCLFFGVYFADNLLIVLTNRYSWLQLVPNYVWEGFLICGWSGKLYSILFALILLYICRSLLTAEDIGLTFHQNRGSLLPAGMVIIVLAAWATIVGISSPKGQPDGLTLLYLAVMPALNEELIYRGFLLGILDKVIPPDHRLFSAPAGWGMIITSILFGLLHGFWLDNSLAVHIDWIALRNATFSGFIFAWLRERTGSLVMPVLAHGLEDFLFFLPRMM